MRYLYRLSAAVLVIGFAIAPLFNASLVYEFTIVISLGLAAFAVSLLLRAGLISFGHGLYYAVGGYCSAYCASYLSSDLLVVLAAALCAGVVVASVIGLLTVRYRGIFFAMLNLALSMVVYTACLKFRALTGGSDGMPVVINQMAGQDIAGQALGYAIFGVSLAAAALLCGIIYFFYFLSPLGWALNAVKDNEVRVEYLGQSAQKIIFAAYAMSGGLAGLGGGIVVVASGHVGPEMAYWVMSAEFVIAAVVGGVAHILGPFIGAFIYEVVSVSAAQYLTYTWGLLLGVILLFTIRFAPDGIWGLYRRLFEKKAVMK